MRRHGGACLLRRLARSGADTHTRTRSEEVSLRDQRQNSQSRGRNSNVPEIAAPRPKLSGSPLIAYSLF